MSLDSRSAFVACSIGAAASLALACSAADPPARPAPSPDASAPVVIAAVADAPYSEDGCDEHACLAERLAAIDTGVDVLVHLGDVRAGERDGRRTRCTSEELADVAALLGRAPVPVIVVPGDNEWNDCANPDEAPALWRRHLLVPVSDRPLPWPLLAQSGRPENRSFDVRGVRVVAVNVVGGRVHDETEWARRHADDAAWLGRRLATAGSEIGAAVVLGHATPRDDEGGRRRKVRAFFDGLEDVARQFDRPLLYLHGDGHAFDRAMDVGGPHGLRVQIARSGETLPTVITVTPEAAEPFEVEPGRDAPCCP